MSLELQDLPTIKVHQEVHCLLKAHAQVHKQELNALVREIIHAWAKTQVHVFSVANDLAKSKGLTEISGDWK